MVDKKKLDLENGVYEEGTIEYAFQRYYRNCKKIDKKYLPFYKEHPGTLGYRPHMVELKKEAQRFDAELKKLREVGAAP